jgi:hypothetical protein
MDGSSVSADQESELRWPAIVVACHLKEAGITCSDTEREQFIREYSAIRARIQLLYSAEYVEAVPILLLTSD